MRYMQYMRYNICDGTHHKKSPWPNKMENQIKIH